jgi:hypothetical protein
MSAFHGKSHGSGNFVSLFLSSLLFHVDCLYYFKLFPIILFFKNDYQAFDYIRAYELDFHY